MLIEAHAVVLHRYRKLALSILYADSNILRLRMPGTIGETLLHDAVQIRSMPIRQVLQIAVHLELNRRVVTARILSRLPLQSRTQSKNIQHRRAQPHGNIPGRPQRAFGKFLRLIEMRSKVSSAGGVGSLQVP